MPKRGYSYSGQPDKPDLPEKDGEALTDGLHAATDTLQREMRTSTAEKLSANEPADEALDPEAGDHETPDLDESVGLIRTDEDDGSTFVEPGWKVADKSDGMILLKREDDADPEEYLATPGGVLRMRGLENYYGSFELADIQNFLAVKKRFLDGKLGLSDKDYKHLFQGAPKQRNTGNCYMVAALYGISLYAHAEELLRAAVEMRANPKRYAVHFPLGSVRGPRETIEITEKELEFMRVPGPDQNTTRILHPLRGSKGWQILEAAIIKKRFGAVDRLAANGGFGHETLLGIFQGTGKEYCSGTYGDASLAQQEQTGKAVDAEKMLLGFKPHLHVLTANSIHADEGDAKRIEVMSVEGPAWLFASHAYTIVKVQMPIVTLANPHNAGKRIRLHVDEFLKVFSHLSGIEIDYRQLFPSPKKNHGKPQ
jgi:hypothetical protein